MTQDYYGTKRITAWHQPKTVDGVTQNGYAVKYADGYISWSPRDVFEAAYQPITKMGFQHALQAMKDGHKVSLPGAIDCLGIARLPNDPSLKICVFTDPKGEPLCEWNPHYTRILAEDWMIIQPTI